jgi:hypothetical protein
MFEAYRGGSILALDSASVTGVAIGEPGSDPFLEAVTFGGRDFDTDYDVWARAQVWLIRLIAARLEAGNPIGMLVIEQMVPQFTPRREDGAPAQGTGDKSLQIGIFACLTAVAVNKSIPILVAPIRTWRAYCFGSGNMKKKMAKSMALETCSRLGWDVPDHNAAEAAMQWLWACSKVAPKSAPRLEPLFLRRAS